MPMKRSRKRLSSADRGRIMAEATAKGMTAKDVAKKYGISPWTYYGWRKRGAKSSSRMLRKVGWGTAPTGLSASTLRSEIRALLPDILREELGRALMGMMRTTAATRRRRRG